MYIRSLFFPQLRHSFIFESIIFFWNSGFNWWPSNYSITYCITNKTLHFSIYNVTTVGVKSYCTKMMDYISKNAFKQGWKFALSLIRSLLYRSGRSWQKSDREQITQIALFTIKNKQFAQNIFLTNCIFRMFWQLSCPLFLCQRGNRSRLSSLSRSFLKSDCERITQVALNKRVIVSDPLRSLMTKERSAQVTHDKRETGAIALLHERITFLLFRSQKPSE